AEPEPRPRGRIHCPGGGAPACGNRRLLQSSTGSRRCTQKPSCPLKSPCCPLTTRPAGISVATTAISPGLAQLSQRLGKVCHHHYRSHIHNSQPWFLALSFSLPSSIARLNHGPPQPLPHTHFASRPIHTPRSAFLELDACATL